MRSGMNKFVISLIHYLWLGFSGLGAVMQIKMIFAVQVFFLMFSPAVVANESLDATEELHVNLILSI
jgi:hypothetical protein